MPPSIWRLPNLASARRCRLLACSRGKRLSTIPFSSWSSRCIIVQEAFCCGLLMLASTAFCSSVDCNAGCKNPYPLQRDLGPRIFGVLEDCKGLLAELRSIGISCCCHAQARSFTGTPREECMLMFIIHWLMEPVPHAAAAP